MWTNQQEEIFKWAEKPEGHLLVEAAAGSGKTTTICEMYKRLPKFSKVLFMAFNKKIAEELKNRGVPASTLNAFGFQSIKRNNPRIQMKQYKLYDIGKILEIPKHEISTMKRLVELGKAYLAPKDVETVYFKELAEEFDIEIKIKDAGYLNVFFQNVQRMYTESFNIENYGIDFSDQISMPCLLDMNIEKFDFVFIDEAQDLAPNKLELVSRAVGSHLICVGDPHQAIYGFAGADSESMNKIRSRFSPTIKELSITFRCGKQIVAEVKKHGVGPANFECGAEHEGSVSTVSNEQFRTQVRPGNYVLCRMSAPLVSECFHFIKNGIRANVLGREIGKKLIDLVEKIANNDYEIIGFCEKLNNYRIMETQKLRAANKENHADELEDKIECISVFCEGSLNVTEVKSRMEKIFDDTINPSSITLSTIHKAKGLEADTVYILPHKSRSPKKDKWKIEEDNLLYVAITRAKNTLCWVQA